MMNSGVHGRRDKVHLQSFTLYVVVALSLLWALGTEWAGGPSPPTTEASSELQEPLVPLPLTLTVDPARAALGEQLFQDVRLSGQNTVACATCHQLALGGADGHPRPSGDDKAKGCSTAFVLTCTLCLAS
jgi:cytochrome c peroxidase